MQNSPVFKYVNNLTYRTERTENVIIMGLSDENTNQLKNKLKNELIKGNK